MVRNTERVGQNRHRKWRTESNGRTRAKRPSRLASIQHCSPARAGPTHAGTERKSVRSESWKKKQRRCPLKSSTAKFRGHLDPSLLLRGRHAGVGMTPRDSSGPLGPRIGPSEVTALPKLGTSSSGSCCKTTSATVLLCARCMFHYLWMFCSVSLGGALCACTLSHCHSRANLRFASRTTSAVTQLGKMMGDVAPSVGEHGREKLQTCDELNVARMKTQKEQDRHRR